jgi:flavorubredoxin
MDVEGSMETKISEIADGIYRTSTYVPDIAAPAGFTFNQFLVVGDEPLMFHTGLRKMFPVNRDALSRIMPTDRLRWIAFGHFEADECGAMNEWLAVAPQATPAPGQTGCMVSLNDFADRPPRVLTDGEVVHLGGGKRVRFICSKQPVHSRSDPHQNFFPRLDARVETSRPRRLPCRCHADFHILHGRFL